MSDPCAMLGAMHKCDCGFVLVASDDPEPMGDRLIHYIRPLLHEYLAYELDPGEFKEIFELPAFLWNLASTEDIPKAIRTRETGTGSVSGGRGGALHVVLVALEREQLLTVDRHVAGRLDPQADLAAVDVDDSDADIVADVNLFSKLTA